VIEALKSLLRRQGLLPIARENPTKNAHCAEFEVDNWVISEFVLQKLVPVVGTHPFPLHELMLMVATVCRFQPEQIFEWGTHIGKSARIFHECAMHFRIATQIHSIDLPDEVSHGEHPHGKRGKLVRGRPGVHLHQGDGLDTSLAIWREGGRKPRVLFLVDGDHSYESVFRELAGITREVESACVLLHDAFYQSGESRYNVGPHRAIEEVVSALPGRYRMLHSGMGLPGMTLLYPHHAGP
jgi:cephalosporin hydroxylase